MTELQTGRPADTKGRLDREIRVYDYLDNLGIEYKRVDHEAANTMEACAEVDKVLGTLMCKNLFLCNRQKTNFYLLLMPGDKKSKTNELSKQKYLDIEPGSVSVMGLMNDKDHNVQLLIDEDVKNSQFIGCHPCVNTSSLRITTKDIFDVFLPAVGYEPRIVTLLGED